MANILNTVDMVFKYKGNVMGCLSSADLTLDREMDEVSCQAAGGWKQVSPGRKSWSMNGNSVYRELTAAELAAGVDFAELFDGFDNGELVTAEFSKADGTGHRYTGSGYVNNLKLAYPEKGAVTFSFSITGNGGIVKQ